MAGRWNSRPPSATAAEPDVGAPVPVRYLLDDPEQADVDSAVTWLLPAALGSLFGLGLLVAGVVLFLRG